MKQKWYAICGALCLSVLLIVVAWPRFVGGAIMAPYQGIVRELARGEKVPASRIADAEESLRVARTWYDYGRFSTSHGVLRFISARNGQSASARRLALSDSISSLEHGLERVPGQSYAWLQLGQASLASDQASPFIDRYLTMSLDLAPWEHRLVMPRLDLALRTWRQLDPSMKSRFAKQAERAVDTAPLALARSARRNFALREVRRMLAGSPIHLQRFNIVYLSPD